MLSFQKLHSSNETVPNCRLSCFFNVSQQISNSYGSINSQSETCFQSLVCSSVDSSTGSNELFVIYDCSKGETRQYLLHNTVSCLCSVLSYSSSSILFTNSILSYYSLVKVLLEDYRTIGLALQVVPVSFFYCR